jgi:CBS domain-containing protein
VIDLAALLRAPDGATLVTLAQRPVALLAANAPLAGTQAHPGWLQSSALPVVERGDKLVGVMTRDALARAVRRTAAPDTAPGSEPLRAVFAQGYWLALSGMVEASLGLLPRVPPLHGNGDGR